MNWPQLIHAVLSQPRLYRRALVALLVVGVGALPVLLLVLAVKG